MGENSSGIIIALIMGMFETSGTPGVLLELLTFTVLKDLDRQFYLQHAIISSRSQFIEKCSFTFLYGDKLK